MFSNDVRERLKTDTLSFTEISRQVGLRWQSLNPQQKEKWRQEAAGPWDRYKADFAEYQRTDRYQEYLQYLSDFKAAQAAKKGNRSRRSSQAFPPVHPISTASSMDPHSHRAESREMGPPKTKTPHTKRPPESKVAKNETKKHLKVGDMHGEEVSRHRSKQACESCRHKKIKCSGERPMCSQCRDFEQDCYYESGKRDQEQKYGPSLELYAIFERVESDSASDAWPISPESSTLMRRSSFDSSLTLTMMINEQFRRLSTWYLFLLYR